MCLLAVIAERACSLTPWLGPRITLARDGVDAWGACTYARDRSWSGQRFTGSAAGHGVFATMNAELIAIVAQGQMRSVGEAAMTRAPPFRRGRWVFAHTGPLEDAALVRSRTSAERQRQCGPLDGELLFAFLLTQLDGHDLTERHAPDLVDATILSAVNELGADLMGSLSFVMSDGETLYAYRRGRPLHFIEHQPGNGEGTVIVFASANVTRGQWTIVDDGTLIRCRRAATLELRVLSGADPRQEPTSDVELPFTD